MKFKNAFADLSIHLAPSVRPAWRTTILTSFLLLPSLILAGCGGGSEEQKKQAAKAAAAPVPVVVATVIQKTVPIIAEFTARADAKDTVELRARVEGFLEGIHFEEGRPVKKGQVLFTLDKRKYEADVQNAKAQLAKAQADLVFARDKVRVEVAQARLDQAKAQLGKADLDVNRLTPLAKEKAVPQQDLDNALVEQQVARSNVAANQANYNDVVLNQKTSIDQAMAAVSAAESSVQNAELDLSYCTITSPIDGLIGQRMVSVGNLVGRGEPTLLATVSALDPLRVSFALSETEYLMVARRMSGSARKSFPFDLILADGTVFPNKGLVTIASRAVDEKTGTLTLVAEFPNPQGLVRPGQFGRVRGVADTVENAILVPQVAVMEQQSAKTVYVVEDGNKVAVRTVVLGERYENLTIVKEGLKPGERVITEGMQKVRPGMVVTTENPIATEK
ncbi:MAG: efflux transporter, family, subunit [Deltaproteobacteria bacterium]|nr:efflux transporter, family, subunit [Deltaproteobacteria bacterium]